MVDHHSDELRITVAVDDDTIVVQPAGEVCVDGAPILREALDAAFDRGSATVEVDLAAVRLLSAAALTVLVSEAKRFRRVERSLIVTNPNHLSRAVLGATGLLHLVVDDGA